MNNTYKIMHSYSIDKDYGVYIQTDMAKNDVADIIIGFQFFIEDNTKYGENTYLTEEMVAYLLCEFFGCTTLDADIKDLDRTKWIDLYSDRENRCGCPKCDECIEKIKAYINTDCFSKICAYYNDDTVFGTSEIVTLISPEEILKKY